MSIVANKIALKLAVPNMSLIFKTQKFAVLYFSRFLIFLFFL